MALKPEKYDFSGWATKNDLKCADGRIIRKDAFKHNDGDVVSLIWNHQHGGPLNVLGHALLENRPEGVYMYGTFNNTAEGLHAKESVRNGDVTHLSIYANHLKHNGCEVVHGSIREVSLVVAGANPGAMIDSVLIHGELSDEDGIIYTDEALELFHSAETEESISEELNINNEPEEGRLEHADGEKTIRDVIDTMNEDQRTVLNAMVGMALDEANNEESEGGEEMKHNVFENETQANVLSHADVEEILADARKYGSLKESVLAHAETNGVAGEDYGIEHIDYLFPDARTLTNEPDFIKREMDWVAKVIAATHHSPFSRIKSIFADITEDEARAKGYIKGTLKKEEVFTLLKRTTTPTTIYKKQKLDRDDIIDITDFNVVAWLKREMRMMLDEEIARSILVGDGRSSSDDDKINELNIRPIWTDADLYTVKVKVEVAGGDSDDDKIKKFIKACIKSRKLYKGSGNPVLYCTEDVLTDALLLEDGIGHRLYRDEKELATALRVSEIVTVPVMENLTRQVESKTHTLAGIIVNLKDYNVGADKGGEVNMFDDFDIDYNQQKYLIETRCSGALTKPFSALAIEYVPAA